jgi:hypothetical protein
MHSWIGGQFQTFSKVYAKNDQQTWNHDWKLGMPWSLTISLKYNLAAWDGSRVLLQGTKWAIFENRSTTTIMESLFLSVSSKPTAKSRLISSKRAFGTGNEIYSPVFYLWLFASWQIRHCFTCCTTSRTILGQMKFSCTRAKVLSLPKWSARPPPWASLIMTSLNKH